jgi:hypothetical protein
MTATRLRLSSRGREGRGIHSGFLIPQRGTPIVYSSYDTPEPVAIAGMNGDNLGDMVTLHGGWVQAGVYLQEEGALGPESLFPHPRTRPSRIPRDSTSAMSTGRKAGHRSGRLQQRARGVSPALAASRAAFRRYSGV